VARRLKLLSEGVNVRTGGAVRGSPARLFPGYALKLINRFDGEFVTTAEAFLVAGADAIFEASAAVVAEENLRVATLGMGSALGR